MSNGFENLVCPNCGSTGPFRIKVDQRWDDHSPCTCVECGQHGEVHDFKEPETIEVAV